MIKLTWGNLRDHDFMQAIGRLYGKPMGYGVGMAFALLGKEMKKQQKLCDTVHEGLLKKFGTADPEKKGYYKLNEGTTAEYQAELEKLNATAFEVRVERFNSEKLSEVVEFSPQDWMILEPILTPFELPTEKTPLKAVPSNQSEVPAPPGH